MSNGSRFALFFIPFNFVIIWKRYLFIDFYSINQPLLQDQRLVGVSSLCFHVSVRCDANLVSSNLSNMFAC